MFFVYVLRSEKNGRHYVGCTEDVARRLAQHNAGMPRATRHLRPWRLIHTERHETLAHARRREPQIKSWKSPAYMAQALGILDG